MDTSPPQKDEVTHLGGALCPHVEVTPPKIIIMIIIITIIIIILYSVEDFLPCPALKKKPSLSVVSPLSSLDGVLA